MKKDLTGRVWSAGKVLLLAGALVATYAGAFFISMRIAVRASEVVVPTFTGQSLNDASMLALDQGLTLRIEEQRRVDPKMPAGHVVAQDPAAGRAARRQRTVKVWLSDGPASATVPALVGESERAAQIRAQTASLTLTGVAEIRTGAYPAGVVIAQDPAPNAKASQVTLLINRGEEGRSYVMPDLIGLNGDRSAEILRAQGFRVAVVGDYPYPGIPAGTVIRQNPRGGFQVFPGAPISLEVSR